MTFRRVAAFSHNSCSSFLRDNKMPPCDLKPSLWKRRHARAHSLSALSGDFPHRTWNFIISYTRSQIQFQKFFGFMNKWMRETQGKVENEFHSMVRASVSTLFSRWTTSTWLFALFLSVRCVYGQTQTPAPLWSACTTHKTYCETAGVLSEMNKTFIINFRQLVNFLLLIDWHIYAA